MKLRISIVVVLLSTLAMFAVINIVINKIGPSDSAANKIAKVTAGQKLVVKNDAKSDEPVEIVDNASDDAPDLPIEQEKAAPEELHEILTKEPEKPREDVKLTEDDRQKINTVIKLSDKELASEIESLSKRIEEQGIFEKLEEKSFSKAEEAKAKETLEKFALLGLEKNRRRFAAIDPELKDGLYAHRDSLKEIREVLNED